MGEDLRPRAWPAPLWFTRDADDLKRRLEARKITQDHYDREIEALNDELYYRNLEHRRGRA